MKKISAFCLAALLSSSTLVAFAAEGDNQRPPEGKRQPPQVAIDACKNLTEGATCQFTGRNSEQVSGTCALPPPDSGNTTLACRPAHHHDHQGGNDRPAKPE